MFRWQYKEFEHEEDVVDFLNERETEITQGTVSICRGSTVTWVNDSFTVFFYGDEKLEEA